MNTWYRIKMRKPISITLSQDNLLWLKGQAARTPRGSVSDIVDRIVSDARGGGHAEAASVRSIVGTIDLPETDSDLSGADEYIRNLFAASARRPMVVRESRARDGRKRPRRG